MSMRSILMLPITVPILVTQIVIMGAVVVVVMYIAMSIPRAFEQLHDAIREARSNEKFDNSHLWTGNGGLRHSGFTTEESEARIGESKKHDDLRRRLDELRSTGTGDPARGSLYLGGQNGKQ